MALYVQEHGHGPDLVLLHGWGLHGGVWQHLIPVLAHDFHLIIPDLPGHGYSRAVTLDYTLENLADQVVTLVPRAAIWLGWSLGGLVALRVWQSHTALVQRLVLVSATPKFMQAPGWVSGIDPLLLGQFSEGLVHNYRSTLQRFLSLQVGLSADVRKTAKELRKTLCARPEPLSVAVLGGLAILRDTDLRSYLPQITQPVRLIHGARDKLVPVAAAEILASQIPDARLHILPTAGHAPFISHGDEFVSQLRIFLQE